VLLSLGDGDVDDSILKIGCRLVLLDPAGKREGARELANAAFGEPVFGVVNSFLCFGLPGDCIVVVGPGYLALGRCFARILELLSISVGGLGWVLCLFVRRRPSLVSALDFAADEHGLGVRELNIDVLLAHAGKFAVQLIRLVSLADVELGLPVAEAGATTTGRCLSRVVVEVIQKSDQWGEGGRAVVELSWKEGHRDSA